MKRKEKKRHKSIKLTIKNIYYTKIIKHTEFMYHMKLRTVKGIRGYIFFLYTLLYTRIKLENKENIYNMYS